MWTHFGHTRTEHSPEALKEMEHSTDEQTARTVAKNADGHIGWNDARDVPDWQGGKIVLDGRFSADELRAILLFERKLG